MRDAGEPDFSGAPEPQKDVFAEREYVRFVCRQIDDHAPIDELKVVVDPGNGTGGLLWEELSQVTGLRPVPMNFPPDGHFPAHMPNPAKSENIEPLRRRVVAAKADIGLAYDGDADRTVAVLGDGHVVDGSQMIVALMEHLFENDPSARCAVSMTTSRKVLDFLRGKGMKPMVVPVGHAKVKRIMRDHPEIDFGGEESGHYFYREFFCCESSLITSLHLMQLRAENRLEPLLDELPGPWMGPDPEPAFPFSRRTEALAACSRAARGALDAFPEPEEIMCEYDWTIRRHCDPDDITGATGVRMDYPDWWFAVRPSGTEPLARLTGEARSEEELSHRLGVIGSFFG
jgi:phosphomannomutase